VIRARIWKPLFLALLLSLVCGAGCQKASELSGTWVELQPDSLPAIDLPGTMLPKYTLALKENGTFAFHLENRVMVTVVMDSSGKYTRSGDIVTLKGTSKAFSDDGYRRGVTVEPWTMKLRACVRRVGVRRHQ
jgi:hypothetical protein